MKRAGRRAVAPHVVSNAVARLVFALEQRFVALANASEGNVLVPATPFVRRDHPSLAPLVRVAR